MTTAQNFSAEQIAMINSVNFPQLWPSMDLAFNNGKGDNIYAVGDYFFCISRNNPLNDDLRKVGFKTTIQIYLEEKEKNGYLDSFSSVKSIKRSL